MAYGRYEQNESEAPEKPIWKRIRQIGTVVLIGFFVFAAWMARQDVREQGSWNHSQDAGVRDAQLDVSSRE